MCLLLETGIRAAEAASITLDGVDWRRAEFTIRSKGGQQEAMPLPQAAGEAILDWLEHGRPATNDPHLFTRLMRPIVGVRHSGGITEIVSRELKRQGLAGRGSAHMFRHGMARQLLRNGRSLPEIGRVLRHVSNDTTMIYAKVHDRMLVATAQHWPENRS